MSANDQLYSNFEKAQKDTFGKIKHENIDIFWFKGGNSKNFIDKENIYLDIPENLSNTDGCLVKTIKAFELINSHNIEYDYIFRTTVASYVDQKILFNYLENKPLHNYYTGYIDDYYPDMPYVSGSGIVFSKDIINKIIENQQEIFDYKMVDDNAFGNYIKNINILPDRDNRFQNRIDITNHGHDIYSMPIDSYLYRLKIIGYRWVDILNMYFIHQRKMFNI